MASNGDVEVNKNCCDLTIEGTSNQDVIQKRKRFVKFKCLCL